MQLALIRPIGRRNQITIPPQLLKRFGLHPGDLVNFRQEREGILMKPVEVVERNEDWTKEDLEDMKSCFEKQKEKKDYIRFNDSGSALKHLKKIIKKK